MKTLIITALFDINRQTKGDGRTIDEYLIWFGKTLQLKVDIVIYTEKKFEEFILEKRKINSNKTTVIIQKLEEIPFYSNNDKIKNIISSNDYLLKMKDTKRVECILSEYNIIQYSKFGWLTNATKLSDDYDFYFWMDAGCSRFFDDFDLNNKWPNESKIITNKITIQCNQNFLSMFETMKIDDYIWDNNCMLVGTLFGGDKESILILEDKINEAFDFMVKNNCINNEQFSLTIIAKENENFFNIIKPINNNHLSLFKVIS